MSILKRPPTQVLDLAASSGSCVSVCHRHHHHRCACSDRVFAYARLQHAGRVGEGMWEDEGVLVLTLSVQRRYTPCNSVGTSAETLIHLTTTMHLDLAPLYTV